MSARDAAANGAGTSVAGVPGRDPDRLLDRPAGESARRLALRQIERARAARRALADDADPEALHDLRVALRRLRSLLRAFEDELGDAVGPKLARRLKRAAGATNPGRDAEVGLALVESWRASLPPGAEQRAAGALATHLAECRDASRATLDDAFLGRLDRLLDRLAERLSVWSVALLPAERPQEARWRDLVAIELEAHREALEQALESAAAGDVDAVHAARIEAKRLRYLLEPVAAELDPAGAPVRRLRALQDLLGEANDFAVLAEVLAERAAEAERERLRFACGVARRPGAAAGGRAGRAALAGRIAARRSALLSEFSRLWTAPRAPERRATLAEIASLVEALES